MADLTELDPIWVERIVRSLAGLKYGSVQITVHDGRIVQIDRTEKNRFDPEPVLRTGKPSSGKAKN
ncbi:MAG: hypothetical protein BLM47_05335 [Candidatus Reconcilbacillus cellulovorans]|uniref:DUF2292 domain-containing protein n=1 Tax=Candidatus Reconcilbacillus cellulovorans TaxID=1906605 RepID=A0A2A6E149_9BACL|nr:MAG: hypothetical protein BLM47_05335 [Candidatus Reconcilbacillus cellulovorans]